MRMFMTKICRKCGIEKPVENFCNGKGHPLCKDCRRDYDKKYCEINREKTLARHKTYYDKYYISNRDRYKEQRKSYREANKNSLAKLSTKSSQKILKYYDLHSSIIINEIEYVQLPCKHCSTLFIPTILQVSNRLQAIEGKASSLGTEQHLYCSMSCKESCSIFYKQKYSKEQKEVYTSREVQPELRAMCLERVDFTCIRCGSQEELHCHHIEGVALNPILSADLDNVATLCSTCHAKVHSEAGCNFVNFKRQPCLT